MEKTEISSSYTSSGCIELRHELERLVQSMESNIRTITDYLIQPPPRKDSPIIDAVLLIDRGQPKFNQLFARINRIQGETSGVLLRDSDSESVSSSEWPALNARVGQLRSIVHHWYAIRPMIIKQLSEPRVPLISRSANHFSPRDHQDQLADDLFNILQMATTSRVQTKDALAMGAFPDIGLHNSRFVALMQAAYRVRLAIGETCSRFVDVGCGSAIKVLGASRFFQEVYGIEYDSGYVKSARNLMQRAGKDHATIIEADALAYKEYRNFDVIYFFRPLSDHEKLLELERSIVSQANPKTLLIAPYIGFEHRYRDLCCTRIAKGLYITGMSGQATARLRRQVRYIGLAVLPPKDSLSSFWQSIMDVSHANGFDIERVGRLDGV